MSTRRDFLRSFEAHYVYRYFDEAGDLLYVGCTKDVEARERQHRTASHWFPSVARRTVKQFADRDRARHAERVTVASEHPQHNVIRFVTTPLGQYVDASQEVIEYCERARRAV